MSEPNTEGIEVDLRFHVIPVLHLARMAISMESMLREIDLSRAQLPHLNETLKIVENYPSFTSSYQISRHRGFNDLSPSRKLPEREPLADGGLVNLEEAGEGLERTVAIANRSRVFRRL